MVIVTSFKNSEKLAKKISKEINGKFISCEVSTFPDGDKYLRVKGDVSKEIVILVESFQPNPNDTLLNYIFASNTLKDLGAKKVICVAPYLAFMRQDKRFNPGEAINAKIMSKLFNENCDELLTVDPHLHRIHKMSEIFTIPAKNLTADDVIVNFIIKKFKNKDNLAIIGPDWESYQWADDISKKVGVEDTVLEKTRHNYRNVDVEVKKEIDLKGKNVVIVDDIISTGNTMIKAAKEAKKRGAKKIYAIGVHGIFVERGFSKMKKYFDDIWTVNTITHETNKIDISPTIIEELKKRI
jgi:ribose-phosphate pyrophosphokinase